MDYEKRLLFADMVNLLLNAANELYKDKNITKDEREAITKYIGTIKQVLYKDDFKVVYKAYCNKAVRLIG